MLPKVPIWVAVLYFFFQYFLKKFYNSGPVVRIFKVMIILVQLLFSLKQIGQSHPTGLTTNLLKLFEPRPPLEYKPPPEKRKCPAYTGCLGRTLFSISMF